MHFEHSYSEIENLEDRHRLSHPSFLYIDLVLPDFDQTRRQQIICSVIGFWKKSGHMAKLLTFR